MSRARNYCFTWNNPLPDDRLSLLMFDCRYIIFQLEVGENGTPHYQGTIIFKEAKSFASVKKLLPKCHLEKTADLQASIEYCEKPEGRLDGPWSSGDRPSQGQRSDLLEVRDLVKQGASLKRIAEECPITFIKFHKGIEAYRTQMATSRSWMTELHIYCGATGTGKTRKAFEMCVDPYFKPAGDWWDGYDGQEDVIIDDFACNMPITFLLNVCDRYPLRVPFKGGFREFVAKRVFITSNIPYCEWYVGARSEHRDALSRRITNKIHFN